MIPLKVVVGSPTDPLKTFSNGSPPSLPCYFKITSVKKALYLVCSFFTWFLMLHFFSTRNPRRLTVKEWDMIYAIELTCSIILGSSCMLSVYLLMWTLTCVALLDISLRVCKNVYMSKVESSCWCLDRSSLERVASVCTPLLLKSSSKLHLCFQLTWTFCETVTWTTLEPIFLLSLTADAFVV